MLEVNSIYLYRNKRQIFNNFTLNLKNKEIILITGDNGVGKTSLLDSISGLIEPQRGSVKINGFHVSELGERKKKSFLYLPHKNCLKENLTINENLESWFELTGLKVKYEDYQNKLKTFNLSNLQDKFINKLSHGQKKKVSLTKLLFSNTKLWLLDEPFNGIDIKSSDILKKIMHNHLMDGGSILFSSHLQSNIKLTKKVILKKVTNKLTSKSIDNWELL